MRRSRGRHAIVTIACAAIIGSVTPCAAVGADTPGAPAYDKTDEKTGEKAVENAAEKGAEQAASPPFPCPAVAAPTAADPLHVLHAFDGADGAASWGSLARLDSTLYGRTLNGGAADVGAVFSLGTDGSAFRLVHSFAAADPASGRHPRHDALLWDGSRFWGTLLDGGQDGHGAIYAYDPASDAVATVHLNRGAPGDAALPHSGPVLGGDGALWFLSASGGEHDKGAIVRLDPATGATELRYSFQKQTGDEPHGRLTLGADGNTLYGLARGGGAANTGVVFAFDPVTSAYTVLHEFGATTDATNGAIADHGFLTVVRDRLWGITADGGEHTLGTVFHLRPDGSDFTIVHSFGAGDDGRKPHASLIQHGDHLYATAITGGVHDRGTVWRVRADGTGYETIASFDGPRAGGYPKGNVTFSADGATMFGTTIAGGSFDPDCTRSYGTVFSLRTPVDVAAPAAPPAAPMPVSPSTVG